MKRNVDWPTVRKLAVEARRRGEKVKDIAKILGISRKTVWKWCKRAKRRGRESFKDRSKRPKRIRRKVAHEVENRIIALRTSFKWGTHRIRQNLLSPPSYIRKFLEKVTEAKFKPMSLSRTLINRILEKHRMNCSPYRTKKDWKYFRAGKPDEIWQIDTKGPVSLDGKRVHVLVIIDDHSRYLIAAEPVESVREEIVEELLEDIFKKTGRKPKKMLVDNRFKKRFRRWCKLNGISVDNTPPYHPETRGKVERGIRNISEEILRLDRFIPNAFDALEEYRVWYNTKRFHLGINDFPANLYPK